MLTEELPATNQANVLPPPAPIYVGDLTKLVRPPSSESSLPPHKAPAYPPQYIPHNKLPRGVEDCSTVKLDLSNSQTVCLVF